MTQDGTTGRLRGLGAVAHPVAILALLVLVLHDVLLRPLLPALVAGKVSDVAGLVVFPLVLATLLGIWVRDDTKVLVAATSLTVVWFAAMKLLTPVASATIRIAEVVTSRAAIAPDVTDLLALPTVVVAGWVWRHRVPRRAWATPVLVLAVLWSSATSCLEPVSARDVVALDDGSFLVDVDGGLLEILPDGALGTRRADRPATTADDGARRDTVCLDGGTCIRGVGHDVVEVGPDGSTRPGVDVPEGRFVYAERAAGGCGPPRFEPVADMSANDAGVVVVAHGSHGVSIRAADGTWTRPDIGGTSFAGPPPTEFVAATIGLALLGWLIALWPTGVGLRIVAGVAALTAVGVGAAAIAAPFLTLFAGPVLLVVLFPVLLLAVRALGGVGTRGAAAVVGPMLAATLVALSLVWAWASAWIASAVVAGAGVVLAVGGTTALLVVRGAAGGTWPVPGRSRDALPPPGTTD